MGFAGSQTRAASSSGERSSPPKAFSQASGMTSNASGADGDGLPRPTQRRGPKTRTWRRTGRLWPLVIAHGLIDTVAFVGYVLLAGHTGWLK